MAGAVGVFAVLAIAGPVISSAHGNVGATGTGSVSIVASASGSANVGVVGSGRVSIQPHITGHSATTVSGRGIVKISPKITSKTGLICGTGSVCISPILSGAGMQPSFGTGKIYIRPPMVSAMVYMPPVAASGGLTVNTATGGHGKYTNFSFDGMFRLGTDYYGVNSSGIWKLAGDLDDTAVIPWKAISGVQDFDIRQQKFAHDAYVYLRQVGDVNLRTIVDEQRDVGLYVIEPDGNPGIHRRRIKMAKGVRGTAWQIEISGEGPVIIQQLELIIQQSQRV